MTRAREINEQLKIDRRKARASEVSAEAAKSQAATAKNLSKFKAFESVAKGAGGIGGAIGNIAKGAALIANDASWYKLFPVFASTVAKLPSLLGPGSEHDPSLFGEMDGDGGVQPTVCTFHYVMTVGPQPNMIGGKANNPVNVAANYLMSELRKLNSRSGSEYDPADLIAVRYAIGSVLIQIERLKYVFRATHTYSEQKPNLAKALYVSKGFSSSSYTDFITNRNVYLGKFNAILVKANYLPIIKDDVLYKRWKLLESMTLLDDNSIRAQLYNMTCEFDFQYSASSGECTAIARATTIANALSSLEACINALTNNTSLTVMYSDIRGAFAPDKFEQVQLLDMLESLNMNMSDDVFDQLHNITFPLIGQAPSWGTASYRAVWDIRQDTDGYIYQGNSAQRRPYVLFDNNGTEIVSTTADADIITEKESVKFLDFHKDNVTEDDILVASRLSPEWRYVLYDNKGCWELRSCGSEVVLYATISTMQGSTGGAVVVKSITGYIPVENEVAEYIPKLCYVSQFHCFPRIKIGPDPIDAPDTMRSMIFNVCHMVHYHGDAINNLHTSCYMSEIASILSKF